MSKVSKTKGKEETLYSSWSSYFPQGQGLTILQLPSIYTGNEKLSKCMVDGDSQGSHYWLSEGQARGEGRNNQCGKGLDLDTSVQTQV